MKILVTGACGFIGRHLLRELNKDKNNEIIATDSRLDEKLRKELPNIQFYRKDIADLNNSWRWTLKDTDIVYHFAGLLGTSELFDRIIEAEQVNVIGTLNLLENMRKYDVNKIVFPSKPNVWKHNVYTITKEHCERYLRMYSEVYGLQHVILCPYNVYGGEEKIEHYRKAVPYFIISALKGESIEVYGNGEQTMDLIYVEDCAKASVLAGSNCNANGKTIEIGTGIETSVNQLAEMIIRLTNSSSKVVHTKLRMGEVENTRLAANTLNMRTVLDYVPEIDLEEGLKRTIEHYRLNLDDYRVYEG